MTKVVITGMIAEHPVKSKLPSGQEKISVVIVDQTMTYGKKLRENRYQVVFTGDRIKQIRAHLIERGDIVAVVGQLNGVEKEGRFYHYIYGQQLVLVKKIVKGESL